MAQRQFNIKYCAGVTILIPKYNSLKKTVKIILIVVLTSLVAAWIYWQQHKKGFIRDKIEHAVSKGTDSVYFIHYDSSRIDAINGNATFFNVTLQSDSLQQQLAMFDTASAAIVYNVFIKEVSVRGANIPALVNNTKVEASAIELNDPVIYIISAGKKEKKEMNHYDTLAIYEKILGKYNSIKANEIIITNGNVFFADKTGNPHTSLKGITVRLKNFKIDSTRDYNNIISYFVKDVVAKVNEVEIKTNKNSIHFSNIEYNAPAKFLNVAKFLQQDSTGQVIFDINNSSINNIATDSFIFRQQIKAASFKTDGGLVKLYRSEQNSAGGNEQITFENDSFDEIFLNEIEIKNAKILVYNKTKPAEAPFILNNARFSATGIERLYSGTNIIDLIGKSNWILGADGFSMISKDKVYKFDIGEFEVNKKAGSIFVKQFLLIPQISEDVFMSKQKYQTDIYNLRLNNIQFKGVDIPALITDKKLLAQTLSLQPILNIYNDRLVTPNPTAKIYPQQQLLNIKFPISIDKVFIKDALIKYKEKGAISKQKGIVTFEHVNGTISNVTNMPEMIAKHNNMLVDASGTFMGVSKLKTNWKMYLNGSNHFSVTGDASGFDASKLNEIAEPLGMASIKSGQINKLNFNFDGDWTSSKGNATLLYEDLHVELLKKDSNDLKKKGLMSFVANMLMKNSNPQNGNLKTGKIDFQRDTTKSFFNLMWKSIFDGAKNTIQKL